MRAILLILILALGSVTAIKVETPYVSLSSVDAEVVVMDMAETVWMGVGADGDHPVDLHSDDGRITMAVANVSCTAINDVVTCTLPPTGHLSASGRLYQNDTTLALGSDAYRVTMTATLEGGVWREGDVWSGASPRLVITVHEQSPEERSERVGKGALCFLVTIPVMVVAEMVAVWFGV